MVKATELIGYSFKVPLPPRREGEAPCFVYFKQADRIFKMR
jgi:hypothetical protein